MSPASAAIHNPTCVITSPADLTQSINAGGNINISAAWQGDTPPFAAVFKVGPATVGTINTSQPAAMISLSAGSLAEGQKTFSVNVLETAVPNGQPSGDIPAAGMLMIDKTPPQITLSIVSGSVVSSVASFNDVILGFTSSESLGEAPKFSISPGVWSAPSPLSPESAPFSNNQYKITVPPATSGGVYTVRVIGRDNTEPAATRNEGSDQVAFSVDASADGAPTIISCAPVSPVRVDSIKLSGSIQKDNTKQRVEVLDGPTVAATVDIAAGADSWLAQVFSLTEGIHNFSARRIDALGNVSESGVQFPVTVDFTPPASPVLDTPTSPVNKTTVRITGKGVVDPPYYSGPMRLELTRGGTAIASAVADSNGSFAFVDVPLAAGNNLLIAQAFDSTHDGTPLDRGNASVFSNAIVVRLDQTPPVIIDGGIIISGFQDPANSELCELQPASSSVTWKSSRSSVLWLPIFSTSQSTNPPDGDIRPLQLFGTPPVSIILAYRRIYAPLQLMPWLHKVIAAHGQIGAIDIRRIPSTGKSSIMASVESRPGFSADIALLTAGKLPAERLDLMLSDIVSERIPTALLPDPEKISSDKRLRTIRNAVLFRRLHDSDRLPATGEPHSERVPAIATPR
ncbi:MAG: hypothetical protein HQM09_01330 [Candidatus Riflebacteria bacterium]|nr:hypothetical protein [Candidatus Riflebacteria bacterium]